MNPEVTNRGLGRDSDQNQEEEDQEYGRMKRKYNELLKTSVSVHKEIASLKKRKQEWKQQKRFLLDNLYEWECALQPELLDEMTLPLKLRVFINNNEERSVPFKSYETLAATLRKLLEPSGHALDEFRVITSSSSTSSSAPALNSTLGELWRKTKLKEVRLFNPNYKPRSWPVLTASTMATSTTSTTTTTSVTTTAAATPHTHLSLSGPSYSSPSTGITGATVNTLSSSNTNLSSSVPGILSSIPSATATLNALASLTNLVNLVTSPATTTSNTTTNTIPNPNLNPIPSPVLPPISVNSMPLLTAIPNPTNPPHSSNTTSSTPSNLLTVSPLSGMTTLTTVIPNADK